MWFGCGGEAIRNFAAESKPVGLSLIKYRRVDKRNRKTAHLKFLFKDPFVPLDPASNESGSEFMVTLDSYRGPNARYWPHPAALEDPAFLEKYLHPPNTTPVINDVTTFFAVGALSYLLAVELHAKRRLNSGRAVTGIALAPMLPGLSTSASIAAYFEWICGPHAVTAENDESRLASLKTLAAAEVILITLCHSEAWFHAGTRTALWRNPPAAEIRTGDWEFRLLTVDENITYLKHMLSSIWAVSPDAQVILAVSPTALHASYRTVSPLIANGSSKANLLAAVHDIAHRPLPTHDGKVHYFPMHELATQLLPVGAVPAVLNRAQRDGIGHAFSMMYCSQEPALVNPASTLALGIMRQRLAQETNANTHANSSASTATTTAMSRNPFITDGIVCRTGKIIRNNGFCSIHITASSTGYEAFTLAIALERAGLWNQVSLLATDHSDHALTRARSGLVAEGDAARLTSEEREFFDVVSDGLRLNRRLLERIRFYHFDLLTLRSEGLIPAADILICNNVIQHMTEERQEIAVRTLLGMLRGENSVLCLYGGRGAPAAARLKEFGLVPDVADFAHSLYADPFNPSPAPGSRQTGVANPPLDAVLQAVDWPWCFGVFLTAVPARRPLEFPRDVEGLREFYCSIFSHNTALLKELAAFMAMRTSARLLIVGKSVTAEGLAWIGQLALDQKNRPLCDIEYEVAQSEPCPEQDAISIPARLAVSLPPALRARMFEPAAGNRRRVMRKGFASRLMLVVAGQVVWKPRLPTKSKFDAIMFTSDVVIEPAQQLRDRIGATLAALANGGILILPRLRGDGLGDFLSKAGMRPHTVMNGNIRKDFDLSRLINLHDPQSIFGYADNDESAPEWIFSMQEFR
jgi:chemotaxis methyl-accepting protein methylase